jgi:sortase A
MRSEEDSHYNMNSRRAERIVLAVGLTLLSISGGARLHGTLASRTAIARFQAEEASTPVEDLSSAVDPTLSAKVDFRLWDNRRVAAYETSLTQKNDKPLAILRIPRISLEVPVFDDTDELALNRGVGRIRGTAKIGQVGNVGIAGHRDGFFRGLKGIGPGDKIELAVHGRTNEYVVTQIQIVKPEDTSVLGSTASPTLTLVTCFPFYFVGSAPQRYIVTAVIQDSRLLD